MNDFRKNPKKLADKLEQLRSYLDPESNILSEPGKIQIQLVEGEAAFIEAINFLKRLPSLQPLQWDENLALSAQEHVNDIGPKGLLLYQSSDGTEPEDRIAKYGTYTDSLGENIDFGPNDALGVIISLTLDDGEEERPHRTNLFNSDYRKVGIACGQHQTEFQMCVMDFAFDFKPLSSNNLNQRKNQAANSNQSNKNSTAKNYPEAVKSNNNNANNNNQSPYVKLSLEMDEIKSNERSINNMMNQGFIDQTQHQSSQNAQGNFEASGQKLSEIDQLANAAKEALRQNKVIEKKVKIITKITYTYEDGSTKEVTQEENHTFQG